MTFSLELVLSGLTLLCVPPANCPGNPPGDQRAVAYMVRTHMSPLEVCNTQLTAEEHHPYLVVKSESVDLVSLPYTLIPDPNGDQLALIDLKDQDLCLKTGATNPQVIPDDPDHGADKLPSGNHGPDAYAWVASTKEVLSPNAPPPLRSELGKASASNSYIAATVRFDSGKFRSHRLMKIEIKDQGSSYIVWDLATTTSTSYSQYKTLADEIVLQEPNLSQPVELTDCTAQQTALLRLIPKDGILQIKISNLPPYIINSSSHDLLHFRWFYRLFDVVDEGKLYGCPVPHSSSIPLAGANVFCPPLSYP